LFAGYEQQIASGLLNSALLAATAMTGAFILGICGALLKLSPLKAFRIFGTAYTTLIRSVPDLVMMLLLYFSLQMWLNQFTDALGLEQINIDPFTAGVITLTFIYGAYFTETFRGAFQTVPRGQSEAASALGMRGWLAFYHVLFPQMMRHALPGIGNNWQVMIKATALVSIIGLSDLVKATQDAGKASGHYFYFSLLSALIFLALATLINGFVFLLQRRYSAGVGRFHV